MTSIQEVTQVTVTHAEQSHPVKTFNGSHPLNVFVKQPILNAWKGSGCQRHCQISEMGSHKMVYSSNVWNPPMNPCVYNPSVATTRWRTNTLNYANTPKKLKNYYTCSFLLSTLLKFINAMENLQLNYSYKNIYIPAERNYKLQLMEKTE